MANNQTSDDTRAGRNASRMRSLRTRAHDADLNSKVIGSTVIWQGVVAVVLTGIGFVYPTFGVIALGVLTLFLVGLMTYNAVYWRMARKAWEEKSPSEQARIQVDRGRPVREDFARSKIVSRTNAACLAIFAAGLASVAFAAFS